MASLNVTNDAPAITSVFQPITISYAWALPLCTVYDSSGKLGITVDDSFANEVTVGSYVQILNGSYRGSYKVTQLVATSTLGITLDTPFNGLDSLSNRFNPDKKQSFELFGGYKTGAGSGVKPYKKIADISVSINPTTLRFDVDLAKYLRSYFRIDSPTVGKDYNLSLAWELFRVGDSVPTASTTSWALAEQSAPHSVDGNIRIKKNGTDAVLEFSSGTGTFAGTSGDSIQAYAFSLSADLDSTKDNAIRLTVTDDLTATIYQEVKVITDYSPTVVGEILYTFTILPSRSYTVTVESASSF